LASTDQLQLHGAPPGELRQQSLGSQIRWFVVLWFLGVLAATCTVWMVKLLMRGAVAL
jgi:hypothetical protein